MFTYRITLIGMAMDTTECPPAIVSAVFLNFNGEPVELSQKECFVTFETEQTPINLGPLVKVELISQ